MGNKKYDSISVQIHLDKETIALLDKVRVIDDRSRSSLVRVAIRKIAKEILRRK